MNKDNKNSGGAWNRAQSPFPTCANHDGGLLELERERIACCESRGDGLPKYGCWTCPYRKACERLWGQVSTQSSARKLLPEEVKEFKERFALLKR